jgi:hypothetical protein
MITEAAGRRRGAADPLAETRGLVAHPAEDPVTTQRRTA